MVSSTNKGNQMDSEIQQRFQIEVWELGSILTLTSDILVTVVAICIKGGAVTYQCVWWDGRQRRCEWIEECEIVYRERPTQRIGFKTKESE